MHEGNYQLLCYIFLDFSSSKEQILMSHYFPKNLYYTSVESYIDQEHILLENTTF